jgi:hypothetical protein
MLPNVHHASAEQTARCRSVHPRSSQRTRRWREQDSNFRFRMREAADLSFRYLSMSPKLSAF